MQPCIQEARIRKLENDHRDSTHDISNLTITVEKVVGRVDMLIKVLLLIAAKVALGLILIIGYFIKLYITQGG